LATEPPSHRDSQASPLMQPQAATRSEAPPPPSLSIQADCFPRASAPCLPTRPTSPPAPFARDRAPPATTRESSPDCSASPAKGPFASQARCEYQLQGQETIDAAKSVQACPPPPAARLPAISPRRQTRCEDASSFRQPSSRRRAAPARGRETARAARAPAQKAIRSAAMRLRQTTTRASRVVP